MIRMWKMAHGTFRIHCDHHGRRPAIRMKISSPAYMLPNSRRPRETGLDSRLTPSRIRLTGINAQWLNGCKVSSFTKPLTPFILML
ncbi:hypothetical protein D3C86_1996620 [compost metagenome]